MEPISQKSEDIKQVSQPDSKTEIEKKTDQVSGIIGEISIESEKESMKDISEDQSRKKEILAKLESFKDKFDSEAEEYVKGLSTDELNDPEILEQVFNKNFSESWRKFSRKTVNYSKFFNDFLRLLKIKERSLNAASVKFLISKSPYPIFDLKYFSNDILKELVKDKKWIIDLFRKSKNDKELLPQNIPSVILDELKTDKDFRIKVMACCPSVNGKLKFNYKNSENSNELIEILKISDHPFEIISKYADRKLLEKIMTDKEFLILMNKNSIADEDEKASFELICRSLKMPIFDSDNPKDLSMIRSAKTSNFDIFGSVNKFPNLFKNGKIPNLGEANESDLLEVFISNKNRPLTTPLDSYFFSNVPLLEKILQIDPRYLENSRLRRHIESNREIKEKLFSENGHFLFYFYDDKETIIAEAKKLDLDQLKKLYSEVANDKSVEKDRNPLFYESLLKSLKILINDREVNKTKEVSSKVYFHFE